MRLTGLPFKWSMNRHSGFMGCRRKYFFRYYGSAHDDEVERLKSLSGIHLWAGNLVHDAISGIIKSWEWPSNIEKFIRRITHGQMPQDWMFSQAGTKRFRLWEHEYGEIPDRAKKGTIIEKVRKSMTNFFSGWAPHLQKLGKSSVLECEDKFIIGVNGREVTGAIDLALRVGDRAILVDWKTGKPDAKHNRQMHVYALRAQRAGWVKDSRDAECSLSYLLGATIAKPKPPTTSSVEFFIGQSIDAMERAAPGNVADIEEFPMTTNEWECKWCEFRRICWPGRTFQELQPRRA